VTSLVPLAEIESAAAAVAPHIHRTPLVESRTLSERLGRRVSLKLELFQRTGSFKPRGALYEVMALSDEERSRGVVGLSGGNYAQGLAYSGERLGVPIRVVMPASAPAASVEATTGYGAEIELAPTMSEAFERFDQYRAGGVTTLHPFDDPRMWAGNGSLGLEVVEDAPDLTDILVSIGGGGFITGVTSAVLALRPEVRVWGVETEGADAMRRALDAGKVVDIVPTSIATTLSAPRVAESTLAVAREHLEDVVVGPDAEAVVALEVLAERVKVLAEPAASCTLAAAQQVRARLGEHVVLVLCGGNVSLDDLTRWRAHFGG
ncbi:MAG TPA: threonine/serine dehydratase, partial [Acidimicrobiia bacterium]|nr:threonine/serine dehydratase [Acidimicrobiia bacterium]